MSAVKHGDIHLNLVHGPLTETSVGFYFHKIAGWHVLHQGVLWERYRAKYPELEILPTIVDPSQSSAIQFDLSSPVLRTGFSNRERTQLLQIQDGLILHNWRKTPNAPNYGHYEEIKTLLKQDWQNFVHYLNEAKLSSPAVTKCEMSYFNHLVRGEHWMDFADLSDLLVPWKGLPTPTHGIVQNAAFGASHQLKTGMVNLAIQPGIRSSDGKEVVQFTLTSVTVPSNSSDEAVFQGLDNCHDNAQHAFVDFTTDQARERWR